MKKLFQLAAALTLVLGLATTTASAQQRKAPVKRTNTTTQKKTTTAAKPAAKTTEAKAVANPTPKPVDMGLSVKWSDVDLGAPTSKSAGALYSPSINLTEKLGDGWRLPTKEEVNELIQNCTREIKVVNNIPSHIIFTSKKNGAQIIFYIPKIIQKNYTTGETMTNPAPNNFYVINIANNKNSGTSYREHVIMVANMKKLIPAQYNDIQNKMANVGMKGKKVSEWSSDVVSQIESAIRMPLICSDDFIWIGMLNDFDFNDNREIQLRPVYSVNDED